MNTTLCNMVMIENADTGRVLVQHSLPKASNPWCGLTFPGGHAEFGESVTDSAVREIREETGLTVSKLRLCGMVEWLTPGNPSEDAPAEVTTGSRYKGRTDFEQSAQQRLWKHVYCGQKNQLRLQFGALWYTADDHRCSGNHPCAEPGRVSAYTEPNAGFQVAPRG